MKSESPLPDMSKKKYELSIVNSSNLSYNSNQFETINKEMEKIKKQHLDTYRNSY